MVGSNRFHTCSTSTRAVHLAMATNACDDRQSCFNVFSFVLCLLLQDEVGIYYLARALSTKVVPSVCVLLLVWVASRFERHPIRVIVNTPLHALAAHRDDVLAWVYGWCRTYHLFNRICSHLTNVCDQGHRRVWECVSSADEATRVCKFWAHSEAPCGF